MRIRLLPKLFLLLLAAMSAVLLLMMLLLRWSLDRGFLEYLNALQAEQLAGTASRLEAFYAGAGSFEPLRHNHELWRELTRDPLAPERGSGRRPPPEAPWQPPWREGAPPDAPRQHGPGPGRDPLLVGPRLSLFDAERQWLFGRDNNPAELHLTPLRHAGETVGWLGLRPLRVPPQGAGERFLRRQGHNLWLIAGAMVLLAALGSLLLARRLITPVRALAGSARALAAGDLSARVTVAGGDELAELGSDFNHLAATLEANEQARRRWVADISHELRTPVAVLRGEIEALQDGIRPLDGAALDSLHGEAARLGKLVEDLYQLALSDLGALRYQMQPLDPAQLLKEALAAFRGRFEQAGIELDGSAVLAAGEVLGDSARLRQLFDNLLENSARYTDRPGRLVVRTGRAAGAMTIDFEDSAPGVPPELLPRLFDRLWRAESSRNRARGGAGLGLAIAAEIVRAHQGGIEAQPSPLGGVRIRVTLPARR